MSTVLVFDVLQTRTRARTHMHARKTDTNANVSDTADIETLSR